MVLPEKAIIIAKTEHELAWLLETLDDNGHFWRKDRTCSSMIDTIWKHPDIQRHIEEGVAISIRYGYPDGYCWPSWFFRLENECYLSKDPMWNGISVEKFLINTGGYFPTEEIDASSLL